MTGRRTRAGKGCRQLVLRFTTQPSECCGSNSPRECPRQESNLCTRFRKPLSYAGDIPRGLSRTDINPVRVGQVRSEPTDPETINDLRFSAPTERQSASEQAKNPNRGALSTTKPGSRIRKSPRPQGAVVRASDRPAICRYFYAPGRIRTCDPRIRSPPICLRKHRFGGLFKPNDNSARRALLPDDSRADVVCSATASRTVRRSDPRV